MCFNRVTSIISFVILLDEYAAFGNLRNNDTYEANPGEVVRLNCSAEPDASVDWRFCQKEGSKIVNIYTGHSTRRGGRMSNDYKSQKRYSVLEDIPAFRYDLVITNITKSDQGLYSCVDAQDSDISKSTTKIVVSGETADLCSNDVTAIINDSVQLSFPTTPTRNVQLEHRPVGRQYLQHVFHNGRIVNNYYFGSKRFNVSLSPESFTLIIENTQLTDAGTFVLSNENGVGEQHKKELVIVEKMKIDHIEVACSASDIFEANVTAVANFTGNCPPRLGVQVRGVPGSAWTLGFPNSTLRVDRGIAYLTSTVSKHPSKHELEIFFSILANQSSHIDHAHPHGVFRTFVPDCSEYFRSGVDSSTSTSSLSVSIAIILLHYHNITRICASMLNRFE